MRDIPLKRYADLLYQYLRPQWRKVVLLAFFLLSSIGLRILNPQIIRYFLDTALDGDAAGSNLLWAAASFLGVSIVIQAMSVAATYFGEDVGWTATNNLRADLALHCLRLDMKFHNEKTPGEMIERVDGDIMDLAIFFAQFVIRVFGNLLLLVGILVVLFIEDWRVGLALSSYSIVGLGIMIKLRDFAVPHWKAARETHADFFGFIEEQLAGTEDIRSSGAKDYVMRNLYHYDRERLYKERKAGIMNIMVIGLWIALYAVGQVVAFIAGFYLFSSAVITLGTVYLIVHYTDNIFRPLREIANEIQNLQKAAASIERVEELHNQTSAVLNGTADRLINGALAVSFDNVNFSYREDEKILHDLSFDIEAGKTLGLLGRTGSGKTTITRLLFRLYEPQDGVVSLGDSDIRTPTLDALRSQVGMVTQEVQLFRATVRDNLSFFNKAIRDEDIIQLIHELELDEWFNGLPDGLDTELETGSKSLSAGEAQLLAFGRIFLKDPGLVIMDEASSRLDPATEQKIERAIDKLLKNRTGIIVAHRLKTVKRADNILILENGHIKEYGAYDELASDPNSHFYHLLQTGLEGVLA